MLTVCAYFGTIQGEKINEPEPDLSPICKNKKCPELGPNGLSVSGPVGFRQARRALTHTHAHTHAHTHTRSHTCTHTHTQTRLCMCARSLTHSHTLAHTHTHTLRHTYTHTRTHTHTHTHTRVMPVNEHSRAQSVITACASNDIIPIIRS